MKKNNDTSNGTDELLNLFEQNMVDKDATIIDVLMATTIPGEYSIFVFALNEINYRY